MNGNETRETVFRMICSRIEQERDQTLVARGKRKPVLGPRERFKEYMLRRRNNDD